MEKRLEKKGLAIFNGLTIGKNKVVTIKFKISSNDILTSIELLTGLNNDISVIAKLPSRKPKSLGLFTIGGVSFDKNGIADIPFKGTLDSVNMDAIQEIVASDDDAVNLMFKALIELPDNEE